MYNFYKLFLWHFYYYDRSNPLKWRRKAKNKRIYKNRLMKLYILIEQLLILSIVKELTQLQGVRKILMKTQHKIIYYRYSSRRKITKIRFWKKV